MTRARLLTALGSLLSIGVAGAMPVLAQTGTSNGEWHYYGGDGHSSKYSPLDQIDASNVKQLKIAWTWKSVNFGPRPQYNWEVTPLMIGGVLYFTAGTRRDAVAVDAATGETLWVYRYDEGERGSRAPRAYNRGVAYWTDGQGAQRILLITPGYHLVCLDAKTGLPIPGFGQDGIVDLFEGLDRARIGAIGATSPAIVVKDVVIVGGALLNGGAPKSKENVPGYVRGYDVRTGKRLWTFHTIAQPGEFGNDTWKNDSWKYTGNTAVWAPMSADSDLGYVYLPVETPTGDYYGGDRPGNDLFDESLVCLDARTGKRIWHFQMVHHGIWDTDPPAAPNLIDITVDGKKIKAVAQVTKQAFVYVFDRVTGQPVWPIVEKPVPQSDVPGEQTSPTQPFPTKPPAFDRQGMTLDELDDLTPEIKAAALKIVSEYKMGPLFTPGIVYDSGGKKGVIMLPNATGGANWQGAAVDPETGMLYVPSVTMPSVLSLTHDPKRSDIEYISKAVRLESPLGMPLVKPPWGRITAIDLNTGSEVWMKPNGPAPDVIKNNPAVKGIDLSQAGNPERAALLLTKTLLFAGEGSGLFSGNPGAGGPILRAMDKKTGQVIQEIQLPGNTTGLPMTYMDKGKQYIVVAVALRNMPAELVALTLQPSE